MSELLDRLKAQQGRSEAELTALGEGLENKPRAPSPAAAAVRNKPVERIGVGRNLVDETTRVIVSGIDARLNAAKKAKNKEMIAELEARKKAILEEAALAKK